MSRIITAAPSKSCDLDPLPTDILRQFLPELLPYITKMCNASLRDGTLPMSQRCAIAIVIYLDLRRPVLIEPMLACTDLYPT